MGSVPHVCYESVDDLVLSLGIRGEPVLGVDAFGGVVDLRSLYKDVVVLSSKN
jgi:hypothetical protein